MSHERDRRLARAKEEAEGTELQEDPYAGDILEVEREEAQGIELFEDPDATTPVEDLKQGAPGRESLVGDENDDRDDQPEMN